MVYSGVSVFDGSPVALKFYKPGPDYEGALQRERFVMDRFSDPQHNLVTCLAYINYRGLHCLVMELLHLNIRQVRLGLHVTSLLSPLSRIAADMETLIICLGKQIQVRACWVLILTTLTRFHIYKSFYIFNLDLISF